jgi:hypothetical protein
MYSMLNGIVDSQKVRAQKVATSLQSLGGGGSSFIPRRSEDQLEIEMLKESLWQRGEEMRWQDEVQRQWDEAMRQRDNFYAQAFAQQQIVLQVSWLNYFIRYQALSK